MKNKLAHLSKLIFRYKYGKNPKGWGPRIRQEYSYYTPDDVYQATVVSFLKKGDKWLDIGSGRNIFPDSQRLAKILTTRAKETVGVDPSPNVQDNELLNRCYLGFTEAVKEENHYSLITLRMVAEHVADPTELVSQIDRVAASGAHIVVYTIYKWSPVSIITKLTPFWAHHAPKRFFWNTEERDTFPIEYKMNTRSELNNIFSKHGFENISFLYLDDCRTLAKYKFSLHTELLIRKVLNFFNLNYPELCILAVYKKP